MDVLEKVMQALATPAVMESYIKMGPRKNKPNSKYAHDMAARAAHYEQDKFEDVICDNGIKFEAGVETGEKRHRVHGHIMLEIHHYSMIQINTPALQAITKALFNRQVNLGVQANTQQSLQGPLCSSANLAKCAAADMPNQISARPYVHVALMQEHAWSSVIRDYVHKGLKRLRDGTDPAGDAAGPSQAQRVV